MTIEDKIKREIDYASKGLRQTDRTRWKWGYVDGLKAALAIVQRHELKKAGGNDAGE